MESASHRQRINWKRRYRIELDNNGILTRLKYYDRDVTNVTDINERRDETHRNRNTLARAPSLFPSPLPLHYFLQFFFLSLYISRGAHLLWGERILGHVDRGVADGVVSYVALSQDGTHLGVNLPRLSAAMQEVPADAPSPRRAYNPAARRGAYTRAFIEVLNPSSSPSAHERSRPGCVDSARARRFARA